MSKCIIPWTKSEDDAIINGINTRKGTKSEMFGELALRALNRSEVAISQRYYILLKKKSTKPVTTKTSKEVKPVETNLEKAIRLYPIGTKFKSMHSFSLYTVNKTPLHSGEDIYNGDGRGQIYNSDNNKWAEIIPTPKQPELKESPKQKGIFLDENKLQSLSLGFLRELAVTRLVDLNKENLIKLIVE